MKVALCGVLVILAGCADRQPEMTIVVNGKSIPRLTGKEMDANTVGLKEALEADYEARINPQPINPMDQLFVAERQARKRAGWFERGILHWSDADYLRVAAQIDVSRCPKRFQKDWAAYLKVVGSTHWSSRESAWAFATVRATAMDLGAHNIYGGK